MEISITLQLAVLYAKGWFKKDNEYTILRWLLSKYVYAYNLRKEDLIRILLNKYSDYVTEKIKNNDYQNSDTLSQFIIDVEENKRLHNIQNHEDAIIYTILSHLSFETLSLPKFDFKLIGIKNYGGFTQGLTYKELNKRMDSYNWSGEFYVEGNILKIK